MPDLNSSFTVDSNDVILEKYKDIVQALDRLFSTPIGSVPFNRNYGTHLYDLLFETTDSVNQTDVGLLIYRDVTALEPRIYINPYGVQISKVDEHSFNIYLTVYINDTEDSFPYQVQINEDAE